MTKSEVPLTFKLPGFTPSKSITYIFQIDETKSNHKHDFILGRDIQRALGMDILWSKETIIWENISVLMRSKLTENTTKFKTENCHWLYHSVSIAEKSDAFCSATQQANKIVDSNDEKGDFRKCVEQMTHLSTIEKVPF